MNIHNTIHISYFVICQVALTLSTTLVWKPKAILNVPVASERYAELLCDLPPEALILPLSYNLLLIIMCIYFAFKTRHLPDNFNESKYIFVCVCTTLFLSIAFLPTYFAAFFVIHKSALLGLCLIMNATVTLICLFLQKVYALYWVDDSAIEFVPTSSVRSRTQQTGVFYTRQVAPLASVDDSKQ